MPNSVRVGLVVLSTVLSASGTVPYLIATARRRTRPRIVTWLTWALLTAVGGAASASVGDYPSAAFSFVGTVVTSAVVIVGLRYGDRSFGRLDVVSFVLVLIGFGLWLGLDVPAIAVGAACVIDFIGLVPTLAHARRSPQEETAVTYLLIAAGGAAATAAAWGTWTVTAVAYPVYVLLSMAVCWAIVVLRADRLATADEGRRELSRRARRLRLRYAKDVTERKPQCGTSGYGEPESSPGAVVGALTCAGAAFAHVTVNPSSAPQGAFTSVAFRVPTESDTASTTKVDVHLDMSHPIATVDYQAVAGWTTKVTVSKLPTPITDDDGNQVTQAVSEIVWTADSAATAIKPGQFLEFPIELGPLPKTGSIAFKTVQTYSDGSVVRWIDPTPPGGPEPENPAPVLTLTAAGAGSTGASDAPSNAAPTVAAGAPATPSASGSSSSGAMTIAIIGGLLGLVGAVLGGAAYARTRGGDASS